MTNQFRQQGTDGSQEFVNQDSVGSVDFYYSEEEGTPGISEELACHRFRIEFLRVTDPDTKQGAILYAAVSRVLKSYRLSGLYSIIDVLNEAYERGVQANQKKEIENVAGWIRRTGRNIASEWSRLEDRTVSADERLANWPAVDPLDGNDLSQELKRVRLATRKLEPRDQRILQLKIVERLPWSEVQQILRDEGFGDCTIVGLRKRKERALTRLRLLYHETSLKEE